MDKENRLYIKGLFKKFHAIRMDDSYGSSEKDRQANMILSMLNDAGALVSIATDPKKEDYYIAVVLKKSHKNNHEQFIFKDKDVGLNFEEIWKDCRMEAG